MRWLVCHPGPHFSVHDTYVGWCEALRAAGEHVITFPLGDAITFYDLALLQVTDDTFRKALTNQQAAEFAVDRLCGALYKTRPDVLLIVSGFFVDHDVLDLARRDGVKVIALCTEEPYEVGRHLALAEHVDLLLLDDPTNLARFAGTTEARYMPKAYRPSVHFPGRAESDLLSDLVFVGTGYPSRAAFLEAMDLAGLDVALAGNWSKLAEDSPLRSMLAHDIDQCLDNADAVRLYRSARMGINLYRREAEQGALVDGWSMGPRELEMAACGLFFLRETRGEGDEVLDMLPVISSPAEASELVRYWLPRDAERQALADKASEAIADRTFDNSAARLLRLLGQGH